MKEKFSIHPGSTKRKRVEIKIRSVDEETSERAVCVEKKSMLLKAKNCLSISKRGEINERAL